MFPFSMLNWAEKTALDLRVNTCHCWPAFWLWKRAAPPGSYSTDFVNLSYYIHLQRKHSCWVFICVTVPFLCSVKDSFAKIDCTYIPPFLEYLTDNHLIFEVALQYRNVMLYIMFFPALINDIHKSLGLIYIW